MRNEKRQGAHTGDLNFAAACMAMGIPLDQQTPCTVTLREGRPDYGSWHLLPSSTDGRVSIRTLSEYWNTPSSAVGCPIFGDLMQFIRDRPAGCKTPAHWLEHAHRWLSKAGHRPIDAPRTLDKVPAFVARHGDDLAGHVFAFAWNRKTCLEEYNAAAPDIYLEREGRMAKVSTKLDARQRDSLISRLKG